MRSAWLENLNLSENELKVMKALIDFQMPQNVTRIAEKADLPRSTTLYILRKFEKNKLSIKKLRLDANFRYHKRYHWRKGDIKILK